MRSRWIISLIAVFGLAVPASAQQPDQSIRQQIEKIVTAYIGNFDKQDAAAIAGLYTKDAVLVTGPSAPNVKNGQQEIEPSTQNLFKMGYNHDEAGIDQVSSLGTDAAISVGVYHFTGQGQTGPIKTDGHWTAVYVREGGVWKIRLLTAFSDAPPTTSGGPATPSGPAR
jgi:uncharacterized protein (TIGR02246 family)